MSGPHVSVAELLQALRPADIQLVTRVWDDTGVVKLVVLKENREISGAICTESHVQSFGMWLSLLLGKLPKSDLSLLRRYYGEYLWASWDEVLGFLRQQLIDINPDNLDLLNSEIIGCIPQAHVSDEIRKVLVSNPFHLLDILNDEKAPLSGGKAVLGSIWWYCGLYRWVCSRQAKRPIWPGTVSDDCLPIPSPYAPKALEYRFRDAGKLLRAVPPIRHPAHPVPSVSADGGSSLPNSAPASVSAGCSNPALFGDTLAKALEVARDLPTESVPKAVSLLCGVVSPIYSLQKLVHMLLPITEPVQLRATLAGFTWPHGDDRPSIQLALASWLQSVDESNLVVATTSSKQKVLSELLPMLPPTVDCWATLAIQLVVAMSDSVCSSELAPLYTVNDRASMARALTNITVATTLHSTLKALQRHLPRLVGPVPQSDWAESMLSAFLGGEPLTPGGGAPASSAGPGPMAGARVGVSLQIDGHASLPWPVLQAALAAHFLGDAFVGPQKVPLVRYVYGSVGLDAWNQVAQGRSSWTLPLGSGLTAKLDSRRLDGNPFFAPSQAANMLAYTQSLQPKPAPRDSAPPPSLKRQRSASPQPRSHPRGPPPGSGAGPRPIAPSGGSARHSWPSPGFSTLSRTPANPRAIRSPHQRGLQGPGGL